MGVTFRRLLWPLLFLAAVPLFAAPDVYFNPLRVIRLADGTDFVIHETDEFAADPHAMVAYRVEPSSRGVLEMLTARDAVGENVATGNAGQIYGAALLPGTRRMVVSCGYRDARGELLFALVVLQDGAPVGRIDGIGRAGDLAVTAGGNYPRDHHRSRRRTRSVSRADSGQRSGRRARDVPAAGERHRRRAALCPGPAAVARWRPLRLS